MKTEKSNSNLDETSLSIEQATIKTCPQANPASRICCNKLCDRIAYICDNKQCKCKEEHNKCPHLFIESIMNTLKAKIISFNHYQTSIISKIDKTIDELCDLKEKLQILIKQNLTLYGLTTKDKNLYHALNEQKTTGRQIIQFFHEAVYQENKFVQKESIDKKFDDLWKSIDAEIKNKSSEFIKLLESINVKDSVVATAQMFKGSKITMSEVENKILWKMFGDKVPKPVKLLYRASENNFQASKFHEKCDNIPHTLTLCETVHGKVIGGYTPLLWNNKGGSYLKDESGSSFIFSLTNNHKFTLDKSKDATYPHSTLGPAFGSGSPDFFIRDLGNKTNNQYAQINQSYSNENYTAKNGDSYMKFTGNPDKSYNYTAKEWQVWQLQFA